MAVTILGIRHHGVGSAKRVLERLQELAPDMVFIEGPPEITDLLPTIGSIDIEPPVSLMVYNIDNPKQSVFYPFAEYSPEWVAAKYAVKNSIPLRALDLPASLTFQMEKQEAVALHKEPLAYFAEIENMTSGEEWWEYRFERGVAQTNASEHFEAIELAMSSLRESGIESHLDHENTFREAYMRELIRKAENELYQNIVVVCGAWHAPALLDMDAKTKADTKTLKALPKTKIKIACTWIPWTNSRLSMFSGYGAGIQSPGWYEHQWKIQEDLELKWLIKVADLFRDKQVDVSASHVIETFRLAEGLASLRNKSKISIKDLHDAIVTVICFGDEVKLKLIEHDLHIGYKLGKVPSNIPKVPLQSDFEFHVGKLKLPQQIYPKQYDLDLRKDLDLKRSIFFHRLEILGIQWATRTYSRSKGTFKESWTLVWNPESIVELVDKSFWGNTVELACSNLILDKVNTNDKVSEIAELLLSCIPAELYNLVEQILQRIDDLSVISNDISDLMLAIGSIAEVSRYGNVRGTDTNKLQTIIEKLLLKISINLPNACYGLDEDTSDKMFGLIGRVNDVVILLDNITFTTNWHSSLFKVLTKDGVNPILVGCTCRLLLDARKLKENEAEKQFSLAVSNANQAQDIANYLEGFFRGSGAILLYDHALWNLLWNWVKSLPEESFLSQLPYLKRTFSKFEFAERRRLGEKVVKGSGGKIETPINDIDEVSALKVLPILKLILNHGK